MVSHGLFAADLWALASFPSSDWLIRSRFPANPHTILGWVELAPIPSFLLATAFPLSSQSAYQPSLGE